MRAPGINLAETPDFDLGTLRISPARRRVRSNGKDLELEPKVAQVLVALASVRPSVVSRDRLIEQCWDGRIVGDDAVNRCIVALRHLAKEFSPEPFAIETVTRVGYSLVETKVDVAAAVPRTGYTKPKLAVAALLVLLLVSIALALSWVQFSRGEAAPASIAVLPFRNLSAGDSYFAEGIGEEIMGQLAREPAFRVAGSASAAQFKGPSDPHKVGRVLGVDYILEGSVRSSEGQVRINASLVRTRDGTRLWSETYDRKLDHVLEIQTAIGQAVASGLSRRLIHSRQASPMNGEAYALYLNARGLLRSGNPQSGQDAIGLLQQVIRLDPTYAPAWSSLANALQLDGRTKGNEGMIAVIPRARAAVGRALRLDPNLAEAHGVSADLIDADSPQGIAHRRRAAELDARSGEGLLWRGGAHEASGEWADGLAAYHRAHDADPVWPVPVRSLVDLTSLLGDRPAAESVAKQGFPDDVATQNFALARVAWFSGDFSEAARRWSIAPVGSRWASPSKGSLENLLFMLKLSKDRPSRPPRPVIGQARSMPVSVWMTAPPSSSEWQRRNRSSAAELVYRSENVIAAKLMLTAGRARELVATFDSPMGLLGLRRGQPLGTCFLQNAAIVAAALNATGRRDEGDALLREADALLRKAYRRGTVPLWFEEDAAGIWALRGKPDLAVKALERAFRRGSMHATRTDLPKLDDEPALRSLRGLPRFEAVVAKYDARFARERQETARALKIQL